MVQAFLLLLLSLIGMTGSALFHPDLPPWNPMTIEEGEISLEDALGLEHATWIDARSASAYDTGHIPNAVLLNEDNWDELFGEFIQIWDGESTLVVYCDSRTCAASKSVADRLKESMGFNEVYVLKGGWETWLEHKN